MSNYSQPTVLCYDGSESAKHAMALAATALARHRGVVLHVGREPVEALTDSFSDPKPGGPSLATLERSVFARATEVVEEGQRFLSQLGWDVEAQVELSTDGVGETIVRVARALDAELIVLGTHGHTTAQPELLGSVSKVVLEASARPVLVVPKDA
jgi:nucleotide-binding universal stress UspA family protein